MNKQTMTLEQIESFEKDYLKNHDIDDFKPVSTERRLEILSAIEEAKNKNKSVSLRVNEYALNKFKNKAEENGWNYQSVISAFIVQYANGKVHLD